jgi:hypothetical protein
MARPKQTEIPGTEQKRVAAIEGAADKYADSRDTRMEMQKDEANHKAKLLETIRVHGDACSRKKGMVVYKRGPYNITVTEKEDVKVRIGDTSADGQAGEEAV